MRPILLLDLDQKFTPCRWAAWCDRAAWVLETALLLPYVDPRTVLVRETSRGFHVYIPVGTRVSDLFLVAVQSLLGSDHRRETLNLGRVLKGEDGWNVLFTESARPGGPRNMEVPAPSKEKMLQETLKEKKHETAQQTPRTPRLPNGRVSGRPPHAARTSGRTTIPTTAPGTDDQRRPLPRGGVHPARDAPRRNKGVRSATDEDPACINAECLHPYEDHATDAVGQGFLETPEPCLVPECGCPSLERAVLPGSAAQWAIVAPSAVRGRVTTRQRGGKGQTQGGQPGRELSPHDPGRTRRTPSEGLAEPYTGPDARRSERAGTGALAATRDPHHPPD